MKTQNVYIVNKGGHDYTNAKKYGKLTYMSEGMIDRYATGVIYRLFAEKLKNFKEDDYLLLGGSTVMNSIACGIIGRKFGILHLLIFKFYGRPSKRGYYVRRSINIDSLL